MQKNAKQRKPKATRPRNRAVQLPKPISLLGTSGNSVLQRYLRCVSGGQPAGTGLPDGDGRLSIVRNHRFVRTLKPDGSGNLHFRLGITPYGVVNQYVGGNQSVLNFPTSAATPTGFTTTGPLATTTFVCNDPIVPGNPNPVTVYSIDGPDIPSAYRVPNATFKIMYTGTALDNSGSVVINQFTPQYNDRSLANSLGSRNIPCVKTYGTLSNNGQTVVGPARDSYSIVAVPRNTEYHSISHPTYGSAADTFICGGTGGGMLVHPSMKVYEVKYSGLSTTASITVEANICVQYLVDPDATEAAIAKPSEAANQTLLNQALAALSNSPLIVNGMNYATHVARILAQQGISAIMARTGMPAITL